MTIRWKLNLLVTLLTIIFVFAAGVVVIGSRRDIDRTNAYTAMHDIAGRTNDISKAIYMHVAAASGNVDLVAGSNAADWPGYVLDDIEVRVRLSATVEERGLWQEVYDAVASLAPLGREPMDPQVVRDAVRRADLALWQLRDDYDLKQLELTQQIAYQHYASQVAIWTACALTVLLFLIYLMMVRHWLVEPIKTLKSAADAIGRGDLQHQVPLAGHDELAELARRLENMAASLAKHQEELVAARQFSAIGEVCTDVAHGLRNPLAAIRASVQLAQRRVAVEDRAAEMLRDLLQQVDRMDQRITRLLEFSRPRTLKRLPTRLGELVEAAREQALPLMEARHIGLSVEDDTHERAWPVDRQQLATALAELMTNATHHSPEGSTVTLRGRVMPGANGAGDMLQIEVVDHGKGMHPATLRKAFEFFFTTRPNGVGMGLAQVRRVIERHGGTIELSSAVGAGTTATIRLPHAANGV